MPIYFVKTVETEIWVRIYRVQAGSEAEAREAVENGRGEQHDEEFIETESKGVCWGKDVAAYGRFNRGEE